MRRVTGLLLGAAFALVGLTACMSDNGERRSAALVSVTGTGGVAFQRSLSASIPLGDTFEWDSFTVHPSKLLVIERVDGSVYLPAGQEVKHVLLRTRVGGNLVTHWLRKPEQSGTADFYWGEQVTIYADPGTTVEFGVARTSAGSGSPTFFWYISGYLVDRP